MSGSHVNVLSPYLIPGIIGLSLSLWLSPLWSLLMDSVPDYRFLLMQLCSFSLLFFSRSLWLPCLLYTRRHEYSHTDTIDAGPSTGVQRPSPACIHNPTEMHSWIKNRIATGLRVSALLPLSPTKIRDAEVMASLRRMSWATFTSTLQAVVFDHWLNSSDNT